MMDELEHNFGCGIDGENCCRCGCQMFTIMRERTEKSLSPCPGRERMAKPDKHDPNEEGRQLVT